MRFLSTALGLVLAGATVLTPAVRADDPEPPLVRAVEISGVEAYRRDRVLKAIRLEPGNRLRRDPAEIASRLETRYRLDGYLAARVRGAFEAESGTLRLEADEGRLASIAIEGLEGAAEARAVRELDLETGSVVRESEVRKAITRLERSSRGALHADTRQDPDPYSTEATPRGALLTIRLRSPGARLGVRPWPGLAGLRNRVDGYNLGAMAELTAFDRTSFNHASVYAGARYLTASDGVRYALGVLRPFGSERRLTLGYELHDLTFTEDIFRFSGLGDRGYGVPLTRADYFRRRGHEAYAFVRLGDRAHLGVTWRGERYASLPVAAIGSESDPPPPNAAIDEGRMRSLIATARWSLNGQLFRHWRAERDSFRLLRPYFEAFDRYQSLRAEATLEWASAGALGGDFTFRRLIGNLRGHRRLSTRASLDARLLVGLNDGAPPAQKRFALGGIGTLRGYEMKEFAGEQMALATVEASFQAAPPLPILVLFYDGGTAWTRDVESEGWKSDLGAGLQWPGGSVFLRVDAAFPLARGPGRDNVKVTARLQLPF